MGEHGELPVGRWKRVAFVADALLWEVSMTGISVSKFISVETIVTYDNFIDGTNSTQETLLL